MSLVFSNRLVVQRSRTYLSTSSNRLPKIGNDFRVEVPTNGIRYSVILFAAAMFLCFGSGNSANGWQGQGGQKVSSTNMEPTHTVFMKSGREFRGVVKPVKKNGRTTSEILLTLQDGTQMRLGKTQYYRFAKETGEEKEYRKRVKAVGNTAKEQWEFALWCKKLKLMDQYKEHAYKVVELQPDHKDARRVIGFVKRTDAGVWVKSNDGLHRMGYDFKGGKAYIPSAQGLSDRILAEGNQRVQEKRKIKSLLKKIRMARKPGKKAAAERELLELNSPAMLDTAIKNFENKKLSDEQRLLLRDLITRIDSRASLKYQMNLYLHPNANNRFRASLLKRIQRKEDRGDVEFAIGHFLRALNPSFSESKEDKNNFAARTKRIDLAANALENLGSKRGITQLINALRVEYRFKTSETATTGVGPGGVQGYGGNSKKERTHIVTKTSKGSLSALRKMTGQDFQYDQKRWFQWWVEKNDPGRIDLRRDL